MEKFTIYCTEEQTKKALELGAPIHKKVITCWHTEPWGYEEEYEKETDELILPTAEQMLGWLRSKGLRFEVDEFTNATYWQYHIEPSFKCGKELCYKDAVLSLIDAALDYLIKNRQSE